MSNSKIVGDAVKNAQDIDNADIMGHPCHRLTSQMISVPRGPVDDNLYDVDNDGIDGDATGSVRDIDDVLESVRDVDDDDATDHPSHRPTSQMLSPILSTRLIVILWQI
ncbi:unnamed protein product, partial [Onchocerca ochengi]|uniref:Uncharacterized protein n=1 Tax=Onchocerca ochengi TaxID=42157 RepID=A0A182EXK3_ONCOC